MKKVKCKHCNYEWETESDMFMITCPSCQKKTPTYKKLPVIKNKDMIKEIKQEVKND